MRAGVVPLLRFERRATSPFERDDFINLSTEAKLLLNNRLVAGPGIEPGTEAYETSEIPFLYPAIDVTTDPLAVVLQLFRRLIRFLCER